MRRQAAWSSIIWLWLFVSVIVTLIWRCSLVFMWKESNLYSLMQTWGHFCIIERTASGENTAPLPIPKQLIFVSVTVLGLSAPWTHGGLQWQQRSEDEKKQEKHSLLDLFQWNKWFTWDLAHVNCVMEFGDPSTSPAWPNWKTRSCVFSSACPSKPANQKQGISLAATISFVAHWYLFRLLCYQSVQAGGCCEGCELSLFLSLVQSYR